MKAALLIDLTRCVGCEACVWACKEINGLPREPAGNKLSDKKWLNVERRKGVAVRRQCMHCLDPACVSACPVGALQKTAEGPVIYDPDRCMGCRYCMIACPFGIPKYEWDSNLPRVKKCILCFENRVKDGRPPACAAACPTGATAFGHRDELILEAQNRLHENPDSYVNHIYGLREAGGTSVLYLSAVPFEELGFPTGLQDDAYPQLTWNILSKLPNVVSVAGVTMFGIWWIVNRRQTVAAEEAGQLQPGAPGVARSGDEAVKEDRR